MMAANSAELPLKIQPFVISQTNASPEKTHWSRRKALISALAAVFSVLEKILD